MRDLVIGSINYFNKPVGRGCAWFSIDSIVKHQNGTTGSNSFILIVDEDIDLRIITRLNRLVPRIESFGARLVMVGERKGSATALIELASHEHSIETIRNLVAVCLENSWTILDRDEWPTSIFIIDPAEPNDPIGNPQFICLAGDNDHFLSSIAYPDMKKEVFKFLIEKRNENVALVEGGINE